MKKVMFSYSCQGFSHIRSEGEQENNGKKFPCQDRCYAATFPSNLMLQNGKIDLFVKNNSSLDSRIAIPVTLKPHKNSFSVIALADGHGGKAYLKSGKGAEFAIQVAIELLAESIDKIALSLEEKDYQKINKTLSKSFYKRWLKKILEDLYNTGFLNLQNDIQNLELTDNNIYQLYKNDLLRGFELAEKYKGISRSISENNDESEDIDKITKDFAALSLTSLYGCTLAVYFELKDLPLWYGFKIGDSDILATFDGEFVKPIKDDPRCFLNETTSLCDTDVFNSFCFPEKEFLNKKPNNVICSSDGIANSFDNEDYFKRFYEELVILFNEEEEGGELTTLKEIEDYLPSLSKNGSGDDVSLAGFISYDDSKISKEKRKFDLKLKMINFIEKSNYEKARESLKPYMVVNNWFYKELLAYVNIQELCELSKYESSSVLWSKFRDCHEELCNLESVAANSSEISLKNVLKCKLMLWKAMFESDKKRYSELT